MGDLTSEQLDQLPPKIGAAFKVALTEVLDEAAERERRTRVPWWVEQLEAVGSLADEVAKLTPEKVAADTWTSPSGRKWYCRLAFTGISPPKEVPTIGFGEICLVLNPSPPRPPAPPEEELPESEALARELLLPGGTLLVDDLNNREQPGVRKAVALFEVETEARLEFGPRCEKLALTRKP